MGVHLNKGLPGKSARPCRGLSLIGVACAAIFSLAAFPAMTADLVVGMPNWPSGQATANIIKAALEKERGLKVDVQEMGTMIAFAGLELRRSRRSPGGLAA